MKFEKILVPTDFSPNAEKAARAALALAKVFGAKIELIHVYAIDVSYSPPAFTGAAALPEGFYEDIRNAATQHVEEEAAKLASDGIDITARAVAGTSWVAIVEEAERVGADLIVMGTKGLTGVKHIVLGSVAERTLRHAPCSVLTVKGDD